MSDREKLIELIDRVLQCLPWGEISTHTAKDITDHLISNGVTVQKWIPVSESYPDVCGMPVLMVTVNKYGQRKVVEGFTDYECPVDFLTNNKEFENCWHMWKVTHWMSLPEPPKGV